MLRVTNQFAEPDAEVEFDMIPTNLRKGGLTAYIVEYPAGQSGQYDGTVPVRYSWPKIGPGGYGWLPNGVDSFSPHRRAFVRTFSTGEYRGVYQYSIVIFDNNGMLVQQLFTAVYNLEAPFGKHPYWIDNTMRYGSGSGPGFIVIQGRFPVGQPMALIVGNLDCCWAIYNNVISYDGYNVALYEPIIPYT